MIDTITGYLSTVDQVTGEVILSVPGPKGEKGDQGIQGDRGLQGLKGDTGATGSSASVTSASITTALGFAPDAPTATRTPSAHTHPLSQLTQSSATSGQVPSWNGSAWVPSTPSSSSFSGNTDSVPEGSTNLYFTAARAISALASTLSGYATTPALSTAISGLSSVYTTTTAVASQITTALTGYATQAWVTAQSYATTSGVSSSISSAISALGLGTASTKAIADFAPASGISPSAISGTAATKSQAIAFAIAL